jgi:hypothetical protein
MNKTPFPDRPGIVFFLWWGITELIRKKKKGQRKKGLRRWDNTSSSE